VILKALAVWLLMVVVAIANGAFRGAVLVPRLGEGGAHVVSTLMLSALIFLLSWASIGWVAPGSAGDAFGIGLLWVGLTVLFEFGFGHFVVGKSWNELLADYNVLRGRIWLLVLVTTGLASYLAARLSGLF